MGSNPRGHEPLMKCDFIGWEGANSRAQITPKNILNEYSTNILRIALDFDVR
jgi:hypothetical protein